MKNNPKEKLTTSDKIAITGIIVDIILNVVNLIKN